MSSRRSAVGLWLALVGGLVLGGCTPAICGRSSDCASGLICTIMGACIVPPVDASTDDGTASTGDDAATTSTIRDADGDAQGIEPIDAAPIDAALLDAAIIDAGVTDGNDIDAPADNGLTAGIFAGVW